MQEKNMKILLLLSSLVITGCSFLPTKPVPYTPPVITTVTEQVRVPIYQPPLPAAIQLENVRWFVITKDNLDAKIAEVESIIGNDFVVFAMTPQSYENMSYNMQELRRYVLQQKEVILYYRAATQDDDGTTAEDWLEKNEALQQQ